MNKSDLVARIGDRLSQPRRDVENVINAALLIIGESLQAEGRVSLSGFGTFELRQRGPRQGRNPATGASFVIAPRNAVVFHAGRSLKDAVQSVEVE